MSSNGLKRLGLIGCGLRADSYLSEMRTGIGHEWKVVALADPNPLALEIYLKHYGNAQTVTFGTGPELLDRVGNGIDAVIIASPNGKHLESVVPAMRRRLITLLEKPVAVTLEDCATMWRAYVDAGSPALTVGFSLRFTPFYTKVKQIIDSGSIGQVLAIEAAEMMGAPLTTLFTRDWRRNSDLAGPMILEKCCHDMDLLTWLVGARVTRVSSFASRTRFVPNPKAGTNCKSCEIERDCRYSSFKVAPYWITRDRASAVVRLLPQKEDDLCVFNSDKDIADHQVVNIEYANGVLAAFTVCMDQPRTTRTIKVNGTLGQIVGDLDKDELQVVYSSRGDLKGETVERFTVEHDGSGHSGGDGPMTSQFKAMLRGELASSRVGMREGIGACLIALAADLSAREGRIVPVAPLEEFVFGKDVVR